jgi:RNA polymerase sigma-70 factor, ECF subfamily
METSDQELWRRAAAGESECFGLIFDRHGAAVHAYCRARSGGYVDEIGESAADLVSVVFLEAWRRRRDVVIESDSALPWLIGVARRVMLHRARTVRRHRAALARLPSAQSGQIDDPADDVARRLDDTRRLSDVRQAFSRLRERDREVLLLCVWGGLDYESAAVALGVPVGTVRSRLSRARTRLSDLADQGSLASSGLTARPRFAGPTPEEKS